MELSKQMFVTIRRFHQAVELALTDAVETAAAVDVREAAGGAVAIPADSPITTLMFFGAVQPGTAPLALYDSSGALVVVEVQAGGIYPLPESCYGLGALAIVADTSGTVSLSLKG
jgi:hypothetical protein